MCNNLVFYGLCILHVLVWAYVLFAWVQPYTALINVLFVVPAIYIVHMAPIHVLTEAKKAMYDDWKDRAKSFSDMLVVPGLFEDLQTSLSKSCFASPISPQGMLVLGLWASTLRLGTIRF